MKIAMIITGVIGLVLTIMGCIPYVKALKNEDAIGQAKAAKFLSVASLFLLAFFVLLVVLIVQMLFANL